MKMLELRRVSKSYGLARIQPGGRCRRLTSEPSIHGMSTRALAGEEVRTGPATVRPYLLGGLAALSIGAAAIHFAVVFEHFAEYSLYGVFFLVISWAQVIWPAVLLWRPPPASPPSCAPRGPALITVLPAPPPPPRPPVPP